MGRVAVSVSEHDIDAEDDDGRERVIPGIIVTCSQCGESVEVYGTSEASVKRGCVMLKEQCGSSNWYYDPESE